MEKQKSSKKELKGLINDTLQEAISRLALPEPTKKVKKLIYRNAKKLATVYSDMMKREEKKKRKLERADAAPKIKKAKKVKKPALAEAM
ncbi:hypothetical protein [Pseudochryseolinea flava]|nr:hypothetical protein [Pseudochryseolinea flava]